MASSHEVTCINKSDRYSIHERIRFIGGPNPNGSRWKLSQQEAIDGIKTEKWEFYVRLNGRRVNVVVAKSQYGNEYLKTEADTTESNNLLSLPECIGI